MMIRLMALSSLSATVVAGQKPGVTMAAEWLKAIPAYPTFASFSVNFYEFPTD